MAKSQMLTSKKPRQAAGTLRPRARKMVRTVARVTTHVSARKTTAARAGRATANELNAKSKALPPHPGAKTPSTRQRCSYGDGAGAGLPGRAEPYAWSGQ